MECNFENCPNFERLGKKFADKISELEQENAELKAENDKLKEEIKQLEDFIKSDGEIDHINHKYTYKLQQTLQEIKAISEELLEKGLEPQSVEHQLRLKGKRELASIILDLITKAEEE